MTSDLASATVTVAGGGLLLAKNCVIILVRNALKPTNPPTSSASNAPTMMNHLTVRTGRCRGFCWIVDLAEVLFSIAIVMSCTFFGYREPKLRRQLEIQVRGDGRF